MSYNIEVSALFEKQLKRLIKKFPSLKSEYVELISVLKEDQELVQHLRTTVIKSVLLLLQRVKVNLAERGL